MGFLPSGPDVPDTGASRTGLPLALFYCKFTGCRGTGGAHLPLTYHLFCSPNPKNIPNFVIPNQKTQIMNLRHISDPASAEALLFSSLTDRQLRASAEAASGLFIAESPKVIDVALRAGMVPRALLTEERHICGDAAPIIARCPADMPVYTGSRSLLASITGYTLTRGVLCAMERPAPADPFQICRDARRVVIIDDVTDTTNIGAIFRSAAALGIDAVLLTPTACDPLNRRAVRVSMGSVFLVPWARTPVGLSSAQAARELGFSSVALALTDDSVSIDDASLLAQPRLALILGTEGDGLDLAVIRQADFTARIPMHHGVDSLNVAAASAVAFYVLGRR